MKSIVKKLLAVAAFASASVCSAQIASTLVWNNQVAYTTGNSPAVSVTSTDKTYSVYVKTGGAVAQDSYTVALQASPDGGVTWATVSPANIYVSKNNPTGVTYQMNVDVKATKLRLQLWGAASNAVFPVTLSAWIVN